MKKDYAALFDLDGTLFDTSDVNYYAYKDSLSLYGVDLDREYFVTNCNGRHYTEFLPVIMGNSKYIEEVHTAKKNNYMANLNKARANVHLFKIAELMKPVYHLGVVTTASKQNSVDILEYFGYRDLFEFIVTPEEYIKVKPDPQGFLVAMDYFGVDGTHTIIFEDSDVGVQAARATGATVIVVNFFNKNIGRKENGF